ncbi:MAG: hypothetical protein AABX10_00375 [Nanoarchaeota archaeon]
MDIYSSVEKVAIEFAKKDNSILGVSIGYCPEEEIKRVYYFLLNGVQYNRKRTDSISKLEHKTSKIAIDEDFSFQEWPCYDIEKCPFLGQVIWRKV